MMSKTVKTVIAVVLGILVVLSIIPVFSFVAWGGYSNSEAENRIMRAERESELNSQVSSHLDESFFSKMQYWSNGYEDSISLELILTQETVNDPAQLVSAINSLRSEVPASYYYDLEMPDGKLIEFSFHKGVSGENLTAQMLEDAFKAEGAMVRDRLVVSVDTSTGKVSPGSAG